MTAYTVVWRVRGRDIDLRGLLISGNYRTGAESSQEPFHFEGHLDDPLVSRVVWIRGSGMTMNESFQTPELAGAPCKTSIGRRAVPNLLLHKLGIAGDIELACVWLPVLGMEEGLESRNLLLRVGMKSRVVKRSDLAARLKVKPNSPIGEQLATQRRITKDEGELIDGGIFADRPVQVSLRFDDAAEDVETILREASSQGLIDRIDARKQSDGYLFVILRTQRFVELARFIETVTPGLAVILSINGSVLYI